MRQPIISYGLIAISILLFLSTIPLVRAAPWSEEIIGLYSFDRCYDCDGSYFPGDVGTIRLTIINSHSDRIKITNLRVDFDFEIESIVSESGQRAEIKSFQNETFFLNFRVSDAPPNLDAKYSFFFNVEYDYWDTVNRFWVPNNRISSPTDFILISTPLTGSAREAIDNAENLLQLELTKAHLTIEALNLLEDAKRELSLAEEEFQLRNWAQSLVASNNVVELLAEIIVVEQAHAQLLVDEAVQIVDKIALLSMTDPTALENLQLAKESMKRSLAALENKEFAAAIIEARGGVVSAQEAERLHLVVLGTDMDRANAAIARAERQLNFYKNLVLIPTDEASKIILEVEQLIREARSSFDNADYVKASEKASAAFELSTTLRSADQRSKALAEITKARNALEEFEKTTIVLEPAIVDLVSEVKDAIKSAETALASGNPNGAIADAGRVEALLLEARNLESSESINAARNTNILLLSAVGIVGVVAVVLVSLFRRKGKKGEVEVDDEGYEESDGISDEVEGDNDGEVNDYGEEPVEDIREAEIEYSTSDDEVVKTSDDEVVKTSDDEVSVPLIEPIKPERRVALRPERKVTQTRKVASKKVLKRSTPKKASKPRAAPVKKPIARRRSKGSGRRKRG